MSARMGPWVSSKQSKFIGTRTHTHTHTHIIAHRYVLACEKIENGFGFVPSSISIVDSAFWAKNQLHLSRYFFSNSKMALLKANRVEKSNKLTRENVATDARALGQSNRGQWLEQRIENQVSCARHLFYYFQFKNRPKKTQSFVFGLCCRTHEQMGVENERIKLTHKKNEQWKRSCLSLAKPLYNCEDPFRAQ